MASCALAPRENCGCRKRRGSGHLRGGTPAAPSVVKRFAFISGQEAFRLPQKQLQLVVMQPAIGACILPHLL